MATFNYNQIRVAVERAEKAADTYLNVSTLQTDFTPAEFEDIKTLKRRIDDYLNIELDDQKGKDGLSVTSIHLNTVLGTITVTYSDDTTQEFSDLKPEHILSIIGYQLRDDHLIEQFDDSSEIDHGRVTGEDGKTYASVTINEDGTITFYMNDGSTYLVGNIDNFGENPITNTLIQDGDLYLEVGGEWLPDSVGRVRGDDGEDGSLPTEKETSDVLVSWDGDKVTLTIERSIGDPIVLDNVPFDHRVADPEDVLGLNWNDGDDVEFRLITGGIKSLGKFNGEDGEDGEDGINANATWGENALGYERLSFKDEDFSLGSGFPVLRALSPVENTLLSLRGKYVDVFADNVTIDSVIIDSNGDAIVTIGFLDENGDPTTLSENIGKVLGEDGESITDINIDSNGDINVSYNDESTSVIGNIKYDRVVSAEINPITGKIQIDLESGDRIETESSAISGEDGIARSIQEIIIDSANEGMLSLIMNSGDDILNIGKLAPLKDHDIDVIDGELFIKLDSDEEPISYGSIKGTDSDRDITAILFDGVSFQLEINGSLLEEMGSLTKFDGLSYDHDNETITFARGSKNYSIPYRRVDDGIEGDWIESSGWASPVDQDGYRNLSITSKDDIEYISDLKLDNDYLKSIYRDGINIKYDISSPTGAKEGTFDVGTVPDAADGTFPQNAIIQGLNLIFTEWTNDAADEDVGQVVSRWIEELGLDSSGDQAFYRYNTDTEQTLLPVHLRGADALYPVSISINDSRQIEVEYNDSSTSIVGDADGVDGRYITGVSRDGDNFTITFNNSPAETLTIPNFDGVLPRWIVEFAIDDDGQFAVRYAGTDYDLVEYVDDDLTIIGDGAGANARYITSIENNDSSFAVTWNDSSSSEIGSIEDFDGKDARYVTGIVRDGDEFTVSFNDSDPESFTIDGFDGENGEIVSNIFINAERHLIVEWFDNSKEPEDLGYIDFDSGILNMFLDPDGYLIVEQKGSEEVKSSHPLITLVEDVVQDDGILYINTTDRESSIEVGKVSGEDYEDGTYITHIKVENEKLIVDMSDGSSYEAGDFIRKEVRSFILGGQNNEDLIIQYNNGSDDNLGRVKGDSSTLNIVDAFINQNYELVLTLDDPTSPEPLPPIIIPNVRGDDGNGVKTAKIEEGEMIIVLDDDTELNLGIISLDFGFAPYNPQRTYNTMETMTLDGVIYAAQRDGVEQSPDQDRGSWTTVRLEGDPTPDAGRPDPISPSEGLTFIGLKPFLVGGDFRNYYSVDELGHREFQIDVAEGNFSAPVYSATENRLDHQVEIDLDPSIEYKWRIRDVVDFTGYETTWSASAFFNVSLSPMQRPTVNLAEGIDPNNVDIRVGFASSMFMGDGSHSSTVWQVVEASTGKTIFEEESSTHLTSIILPWDALKVSTDYKVRVQYRDSSNTLSEWSPWTSFRTRFQFEEIDIKPVVIFDGENIDATVAKPSFRSNSNIGDFYDDYMGREGLLAVWEVYDSSEELVWSISSAIDILAVQVGIPLNSNEQYRIRVRYESNWFVGPSQWSDFVEFTPSWSISNPEFVVSNFTNNVFEMEVSEPVIVNDEFRFVRWEVWDSNNDFTIVNGLEDDFEFPIDLSDVEDTSSLVFDMQIIGRFGTSSTISVPIDVLFYIETPVLEYIGSDINDAEYDVPLKVSPFESDSDVYMETQWEARSNDVVVRSGSDDASLEWTIQAIMDVSDRGEEFDIRVRHVGMIASSQWSNSVNVRIQDYGILLESGDSVLHLVGGGTLIHQEYLT